MFSQRYRGKFAVALVAGCLVGLNPMLTPPAFALAQSGIGDWLGFGDDDSADLTVNTPELRSLGCLAAAAGVGIATILFSGAAIIVTRGEGAATATTVAVPILATAMFAGCSLGTQAAPGIAWLRRNGDKLFGKLIDVIPDPLTKAPPAPH